MLAAGLACTITCALVPWNANALMPAAAGPRPAGAGPAANWRGMHQRAVAPPTPSPLAASNAPATIGLTVRRWKMGSVARCAAASTACMMPYTPAVGRCLEQCVTRLHNTLQVDKMSRM